MRIQRHAAMIVCLAVATAACAQLQSVANDAPAVASAAQTICQDLVPAAEATAIALAQGGAATEIEDTEANYIDPACKAVGVAATAVDSGWLAAVVANLGTTAATGQPGAASAGQRAGN